MAESVRSDARRNREKLLEVATAAFAAADGRPVSLESIARDAGVGIGTLYRHFPNREALVEAIYRTELAEVAAAAERLLKRHPPKTALRRWMDRYASFVAAKRGMAESLHAMFDSGAMQPSQTRDSIAGAVDLLLRAGADDGSLRSDVQADDVVSSLIGTMLGQRFARADRPAARPVGRRHRHVGNQLTLFGGRTGMKLNDAARELIGDGADATLVTLNPDGSPQVSVVWVALRSTPDGDELVTAHLAEHKKVRNVRRDPRVAVTIVTPGDVGKTPAVVYLDRRDRADRRGRRAGAARNSVGGTAGPQRVPAEGCAARIRDPHPHRQSRWRRALVVTASV